MNEIKKEISDHEKRITVLENISVPRKKVTLQSITGLIKTGEVSDAVEL